MGIYGQLKQLATVHRNRDLARSVWRFKEKGSKGGHQQQPKLVGVDGVPKRSKY